MTSALHESSIKSLPLLGRGKVRDMYAVGDDKLLIVASDRISAFDVILDDPIPGKGQVLTELTDFWLRKLAHILPNHSTGIQPEDVVAPDEVDQVRGRAVVVKRLKPILVEAVARGYLMDRAGRTTRPAARCAASRCPPACSRPASCPSRFSRRRPRPSSGCTTRTSTSPMWSRKSARKWPSASAT
ncbi:phosphoribosylaminoimidazolesuccinocarboxamide synthase-like protein [Bordetella pertussis B200]|nr:phosphoribosylaminoimidazolesuccinocarboxamide synthase-like protein [Bordetella pertussis B200]